MSDYDFDLFVIGGGSGGVRAARVSAQLGKRVAIAEEYRMGGTCVIRGCVPKKLYVYASQFSAHFQDAAGYGWKVGETSFDWPTLVANKEAEIARLEEIYRSGLEGAGVTVFASRAVLDGSHTVQLEADGRNFTAEHILIATGGRARRPAALPGQEHCITSSEAFNLPELPRSVAIAGGGYVAVEFANIFHGLGSKVTLLYRGQEILGRFDIDLRRSLHEEMERKGIRIVCKAEATSVERRPDGVLKVAVSTGEVLEADQMMLAIGRSPNTDRLGLERWGVKLGPLGAVVVDKFSRTTAPNIWAIGDVTDGVQLTPVAIHEAMCLVDTLWKDRPTSPDHDTIATVVFSQPEIGTVGLSEQEACATYDSVDVYLARFRPMRHVLSGRQDRMVMKLVVETRGQAVVGAHILGPDAGEMAQLLAIAVKARLTKHDFDRTMAVHPSAAEELVTLQRPSYRVTNGRRVEP